MEVKILSNSFKDIFERQLNELIKEGYKPKWKTFKITKNYNYYIILVK